ncbi:MAG: DUF998 domain-containing protein [Maribacter sp.]
MKSLTTIAGILGALFFIIASILGGAQIEGYSLVSQYISESYANGLPDTQYLRYMYITSGVLLVIFGFTAASSLSQLKGIKIGFFLFAIFYGLGTITTGYFPCDMGCNPDPEVATLSQFIHNTAGFLVYAVVPFCLLGIGFSSKKIESATSFSKTSIICGSLALCFVVFLFGNPTGPYIGLFQRIIEVSILFWVIYVALYIERTNNQ